MRLSSGFFIFSGEASWVSPKYSEIIMEGEAWGRANRTEENSS